MGHSPAPRLTPVYRMVVPRWMSHYDYSGRVFFDEHSSELAVTREKFGRHSRSDKELVGQTAVDGVLRKECGGRHALT